MDLSRLIQVISSSSALIVALVVVVIAIVTYRGKGMLKVGRFSLDFQRDFENQVEQIRQKISEKIPEGRPEDKQYLLLREYHAQGLAQSKISFWFSLIFASLGFAVIITAILTMDRGVRLTQQGQTFITLIAGTIIDAVSALFFVQSNKARQLMTQFFDKLRTDRKLEESLRLTTQIPDPTLQSRVKTLLALNFADVKSTDDILSSVLNVELQSTKRNEMKQKGPT